MACIHGGMTLSEQLFSFLPLVLFPFSVVDSMSLCVWLIGRLLQKTLFWFLTTNHLQKFGLCKLQNMIFGLNTQFWGIHWNLPSFLWHQISNFGNALTSQSKKIKNLTKNQHESWLSIFYLANHNWPTKFLVFSVRAITTHMFLSLHHKHLPSWVPNLWFNYPNLR